jgi:hypothetical protein
MTDLRPDSPSLRGGFRFLIQKQRNKSILPEALIASFTRWKNGAGDSA